ncbi:MAG: hypothetical protein WEB00_06495 [Dehalococcoidia bacterium]
MPLAGLTLALGWAAWDASRGADAAASFLEALAWPGLAIFAVTTFVVWLAWKVDLE